MSCHCQPHVDGVLARVRVFVADHLDADQADDGRDLVAVLAEVVEGVEPALGEVDLHAFDDLFEVPFRDVELGCGVAEGAEHRTVRAAAAALFQHPARFGESTPLLFQGEVFVRDVVANAAEGVHRADGVPLSFGQRAKGVVEVGRLLACDPPAVLVGQV